MACHSFSPAEVTNRGAAVASNFSNIGFAAGSAAEVEALARKCIDHGRVLKTVCGSYIRWEVGGGVELWGQLNEQDELLAINPHFSGQTRVSAGLIAGVERRLSPMDGGYLCWAQPFGSDPVSGLFQFVFDTPDFLLHKNLPLPAIRSLQLAAFAQQCNVFANEDDYNSRAARFKITLPSSAFLPLGLADRNRQPLAEPLALAMLCGQVLDAAEQKNADSKLPFWLLRLRTSNGEIDVVSDPELLPNGAKPGNILQASVWLSGRLALCLD
jgi:hypothetical protein